MGSESAHAALAASRPPVHVQNTPKYAVHRYIRCGLHSQLSLMQVSEQSIVQVFERCHELEVVDLVPSRWTAAQDLLLWHLVCQPPIPLHATGLAMFKHGGHALLQLTKQC